MNQAARYSILVVNIIIAVLGLSLFSLGVAWIGVELRYETATQKPYIYIGAILMAFGLLLAFTTTAVCYAVVVQNQWILNIFAFLSLLLFILYADYGSVVFQLKSPSSDYMKDFRFELETIFTQSKKDWDTYYDYLHQKFSCCGYQGPADFQKIHNRTHPTSCCEEGSTCEEPTFTKGCITEFEAYIRHNFISSGSVSFAIAGLNLVSFSINYVARTKRIALPE